MFTKADIEKYFNAEKNESLLFIIAGITAIVLALLFFFYLKTNWHKGFAVPFLIIGLLQLVVGYTVYNRSDEDRKRNVYAYDMNPGELKEKELPRMQVVMKNFIIYRYTEIALALIGIGLLFYFKDNPDKIFWKGFGIALTILALLTLSADFFAEKRGSLYTEGIKSFVNK
jgi:succinate dehydrogenase hydrophobic anchor subunit